MFRKIIGIYSRIFCKSPFLCEVYTACMVIYCFTPVNVLTWLLKFGDVLKNFLRTENKYPPPVCNLYVLIKILLSPEYCAEQTLTLLLFLCLQSVTFLYFALLNKSLTTNKNGMVINQCASSCVNSTLHTHPTLSTLLVFWRYNYVPVWATIIKLFVYSRYCAIFSTVNC